MPQYLIEFRFHGYARKYLKKSIFDVARRFRVKGVTRKRPVPHITLVGPFETREIKRVIADVENVAKKYNLVNFRLNGFGYFDNPGDKVIYANIEPSRELEELRWELSKRLMEYARLPEWDRKEKFSFHATIAFKDIDRKFYKILSYLKHNEKPNINQHLLRITIIQGGRIVYEYDLMLRRLLNRRDALSGKIWNRTIFMFRVKLLRRRLLAAIRKILGPVYIWGTKNLSENSSNTGGDPGCSVVHVSNIAYEIICQIVFTIISRFLSTHDWRFFFILCPTIPMRFST